MPANRRAVLDLDHVTFDYRTMTEHDLPDDKEYMATLAKGLAVLALFGRERPAMTLSQAAELAGISRATARRILRTLSALGYVEQKGRDFSLAPAVLNLGFGWLASQTWIERAQPLMRALSEKLGENCSAAILDGGDAVFVARAASRRLITNSLDIGARLPAFHTSVGRILLGALSEDDLWKRLRAAKLAPLTSATIVDRQALRDRIRDDAAQGYAIVDEEFEKGLRSIAVPVINRAGAVFAALNLSTQVNRMTRVEMRDLFLPALREVAEEVGRGVVG